MASAIEKRPKRYFPLLPCFWRQSRQIVSTREISALAASDNCVGTRERRKFIAHSLRKAEKPECISFDTERAIARAVCPEGHSFFSGKLSAKYSRMASESQILSLP